MAGWLKQGLSTLGEGLSTLTKEILSEEPPDHHGHFMADSLPAPSTDHSQTNGFESLGTRAEIERLRALVADLEERASRADAAANLQFQQMVREYEGLTISQRAEILELKLQLENCAHERSPTRNNDPEVFREIDLFSTSPPPEDRAVSQPTSPIEPRHPHVSHKESLDSGLVEALEHELSEKDSTIRHLTQEIARSKAALAEMEKLLAPVGKSDAENQTAEEDSGVPVEVSDVPSIASETADMTVTAQNSDAEIQTIDVEWSAQYDAVPFRSDQSVQSDDTFVSDFPVPVEKTDVDSQTTEEETDALFSRSDQSVQSDGVQSLDVTTMCEIPLSINDQSIQAEEEAIPTPSEVRHVETLAAGVQTEIGVDAKSTTESGVQFEEHTLDSHAQTDFGDHVMDRAVQHDIGVADQSIQSDVGERRELSTQTEAEIAIPIASPILTSEAIVQTVEVSTASQHSQATSEVAESGNQSEISGDVALFYDYARIVEESQALHSQLGTLTANHDRSRREVDRLRAHLLTVEQQFALDFELAQQREQDLRDLVQQLENKVAFDAVSEQSAQSASQEVQSQVSTLQDEVRVLEVARERFMSELHTTERRNKQLESSLSNLRLAIDHLKLEQRTELDQEREKSKRTLRNLENQVQTLATANSALELKLSEAGTNLQAQSRAVAEAAILKRQYDDLLVQFDEQSRQLVKVLDEAASVGKARVDTALMKNMLMGYLIGPKNVQSDILRMMMSTLNFTDPERQKVQSNQTSTLRSLFSSPSGKPAHEPDDSFSNMLVKFIEQESKPKTAVNGVLPMEGSKEPQRKASGAGLFSLASPPPMRPLNSQRSFAPGTGRANTATDPSMAQDRMLEDILNDPGDSTTSRPGSVDTV